jgi:hypothetical protein
MQQHSKAPLTVPRKAVLILCRVQFVCQGFSVGFRILATPLRDAQESQAERVAPVPVGIAGTVIPQFQCGGCAETRRRPDSQIFAEMALAGTAIEPKETLRKEADNGPAKTRWPSSQSRCTAVSGLEALPKNRDLVDLRQAVYSHWAKVQRENGNFEGAVKLYAIAVAATHRRGS